MEFMLLLFGGVGLLLAVFTLLGIGYVGRTLYVLLFGEPRKEESKVTTGQIANRVWRGRQQMALSRREAGMPVIPLPPAEKQPRVAGR